MKQRENKFAPEMLQPKPILPNISMKYNKVKNP